jgi:hypothetical protein
MDEKYRMSPLQLTGWQCQESKIQRKYRKKTQEEHYGMMRLGLYLTLALYALLFFVNLFMLLAVESYGTVGGVIGKVASCAIIGALILAAHYCHKA